MASATPHHLKARKTPRQARSTATLDAIFEATIQLLVADGPHRLTTTRVAERAGVSVGTMYQYFPHKQALLYALNERYLDVLSEKIEATCLAHHGSRLDVMIGALIETYWRAKTERADVTRALYRTAVELDNEAMIESFGGRVDAATLGMLASASDWKGEELATVSLTLVTVIFGTIRNAFERNLPPSTIEALRGQMLQMCRAYLETIKANQRPVSNGASDVSNGEKSGGSNHQAPDYDAMTDREEQDCRDA